MVFHFGSAPLDEIKRVEGLIKATSAKLLIIDVLQKFCRLRDLNDYAQVTNALEPLLNSARNQDCHILLTHHAGKADRPDGDDILGSTGLSGGVDTSIIIKKRDQRRTFFTIQRYGVDIEKTVLELDQTGALRALGSKAEVDVNETSALVLEALQGGPLNRDEILDRIERNRSIIIKTIARLFDEKKITREGTGKKGDPFIYKNSVLPFPGTIENGKTESFSASNSAPQKELFRSGRFQNFATVRKLYQLHALKRSHRDIRLKPDRRFDQDP